MWWVKRGVPLADRIAESDLGDPVRESPRFGRPVTDGVVEGGKLLQLRSTHEIDTHVDHSFVGHEEVPTDQGHAGSQVEDDVVECNFHNGEFNIRTGEVVSPPCMVPMASASVPLNVSPVSRSRFVHWGPRW